jgi:anthraniloyl-CoA monooxygenase
MRIVVAGGGPAGLSFAMLMKIRRPSVEIVVRERRLPGDTYGWGITLPVRTVTRLGALDEPAAAEITRRSASWDRMSVFRLGRRVDMTGMRLIGISRLTLLEILQARCRDLGVTLEFGCAVDPAAPPACDLLVAADGARSALRQARGQEFGTVMREGANRYVWLFTPRRFEGLGFCFVDTEHGPLVAHAYPFGSAASTFVVECGPETWTRAALEERSGEDTCAWLATVFSDALAGQPLVFQRELRWARFVHVAIEAWSSGRMVLIGDAAHAIHFSVGSGTMLALEDADELSAGLAASDDIASALHAFGTARAEAIEEFRAIEDITVPRLEHLDQLRDQEPLALALRLLSR